MVQEVWEGVGKGLTSAQYPQIELLHSLMVRQLEVNQVELAEVSQDDFCALGERNVHHEDDELGDLLLHPVEHLLHDLDSLEGQELPLVLLLILEGAAPHEEPAHEDVGALALHIEFGAQLVAPRQNLVSVVAGERHNWWHLQ